jgi:hypothetical protein
VSLNAPWNYGGSRSAARKRTGRRLPKRPCPKCSRLIAQLPKSQGLRTHRCISADEEPALSKPGAKEGEAMSTKPRRPVPTTGTGDSVVDAWIREWQQERRELVAAEAALAAATAVHREKDSADAVNHPRHYTAHPSGVECIDVVEHFNFNLGNVIKYIWRAGLKGGGLLEDLKKARWCLDREIGRLERHADAIAKHYEPRATELRDLAHYLTGAKLRAHTGKGTDGGGK